VASLDEDYHLQKNYITIVIMSQQLSQTTSKTVKTKRKALTIKLFENTATIKVLTNPFSFFSLKSLTM